MADITLATPGTRQKASTTNTLNPPLVITNTVNDASDLIETIIPYEDLAPTPATMDGLVTKRVVLPGAHPEAPAAPTEAKADAPAAPAAKADSLDLV